MNKSPFNVSLIVSNRVESSFLSVHVRSPTAVIPSFAGAIFYLDLKRLDWCTNLHVLSFHLPFQASGGASLGHQMDPICMNDYM